MERIVNDKRGYCEVTYCKTCGKCISKYAISRQKLKNKTVVFRLNKSRTHKFCGRKCYHKRRQEYSKQPKTIHSKIKIGQKFNSLTVIEMNQHIKWRDKIKCLCDCGNIAFIAPANLLRPDFKSCGCKNRSIKAGETYSQKVNRLFNITSTDIRYIIQKYNNRERLFNISQEYGVSVLVIKQILIEHNIEIRDISGENNPGWTGYKEIGGSYIKQVEYGAKSRNLEYNISGEFLWKLFLKQGRKCALSGEYIKFASVASEQEQTASLDRIDSSKGYTEDNVQWVHKTVNIMKQNYEQKEFIRWCNKISNNTKDNHEQKQLHIS